jgi:putative cardiolipin synthase
VERLLPDFEACPGLTGVCPVDSNVGDFSPRLINALLATTSLDLQYYIWRDDLTGRLHAAKLLCGRSRGAGARRLRDSRGTVRVTP